MKKPRFRLLSLLLFVGAISVVLALLAPTMREAQNRARVTKDLQRLGVYYVAFDDQGGPYWISFSANNVRVDAASLARYPTIKTVDFAGSCVDDAGLRGLSGLRALQHLMVSNTSITDRGLRELERIPSLKIVILHHTATTDGAIESLIKLPNLKGVDLTDTLVSQEGVDRLRKTKPSIGIRWEPAMNFNRTPQSPDKQ
jgi:hypothetical protein